MVDPEMGIELYDVALWSMGLFPLFSLGALQSLRMIFFFVEERLILRLGDLSNGAARIGDAETKLVGEILTDPAAFWRVDPHVPRDCFELDRRAVHQHH